MKANSLTSWPLRPLYVVKAANITTAGAAAASHGGGTRTRIDEKSRFVLKIRLFLDDVCFFECSAIKIFL